MDITYKTYTNRKHTLYFLLLLASYICLVDGCKCGSSLSGHGKTDETLSISNGYNLLTIGCMEGAKQSFIVRLDLPFSYMNLPSESYLVVIGLPKNDIWSQKKWKKDLSKRVIQSIGDGMQRSWGRDNTFIFLHKANKLSRPILSVELEEADYHALMHGSHDVYVIALDPKKPNTPLDYSGPIPLVGKPQPLPAYSGIGLQAQYAIREEMAGQSKWRIQGSMDNSYPIKNTRDIEVGFLLVKEQSTYDPWCLVQQRVIDKSDNAANYLDDVIMVPATLNTTDCLITSERSSNNLPQQGRFKLLAYLKQGNHYYVGQMDHLASKGVNTTNKAQIPPLTIDFEDYSLKLPRLEILLHKTGFSDTIQDVTLEGLDIHHCIKGVQTTWPSGVTGCLLLCRKETSDQAHLSTLECNRVTDLFSALQPAQNSAITQDKKLCLIANQTEKITPLSFPFFELKPGYTFFICGFSEKDKRLQYYTALDSGVVTIMEKQKRNFVIPDNGAKHGPIHSATPSIKDDIIPSNQSENLQPSKEITGIFSMDDCGMGSTLFDRERNIQGVICIQGDTTQLLSLDDLAKYVSDYLQNSAKCKPTEGVFVFKNGEVEQEAIAIGHKPNKFYHWSTGLDKPTSGNDVELCQGHDVTLK